MKKDLRTILKGLRDIESGAEYKKRSRTLLLAVKPEPKPSIGSDLLGTFETLRWVLTAEVLMVFLITALIFGYYSREENKNNLVAEANDINASIQVKLNEIQYFLKNQGAASTSEITSLNEALRDVVINLNQAGDDLKTNNIESSLNKIKAVQKIFEQIESKIKIPEINATSTPLISPASGEETTTSTTPATP